MLCKSIILLKIFIIKSSYFILKIIKIYKNKIKTWKKKCNRVGYTLFSIIINIILMFERKHIYLYLVHKLICNNNNL